jgi:hypothetical protein
VRRLSLVPPLIRRLLRVAPSGSSRSAVTEKDLRNHEPDQLLASRGGRVSLVVEVTAGRMARIVDNLHLWPCGRLADQHSHVPAMVVDHVELVTQGDLRAVLALAERLGEAFNEGRCLVQQMTWHGSWKM